MEEEWAEGADGFFTEFAASTATGEKSARRRNREMNQEKNDNCAGRTARTEVDRKMSVEDARKKIAAAVLSRASAKEVAAAQKRQGKGKGKSSGDASDEASQKPPKFYAKKRAKVDEKFVRKQTRKEEAKEHAHKYRRSLKK